MSPLSPSFRSEIRARLGDFSRLEPRRALGAFAFDWALIALAMAAAILSGGQIAVVLAALVIIGGRQHALFALLHEGVHARLSENRAWNDRLANLLAGYPIFMSVEAYRANHLRHHRHLNTDEDPDWVRKAGSEEWRFPCARSRLGRTFAGYLWGRGLAEAYAVARLLSGLQPLAALRDASARRELVRRLAYFAGLGALAFATGRGVAIAGLWLGAYVLVLPVLMRLRSLAEHFGVANEHDLNRTRTSIAPWWERALFTPHNIGYHLEHHLYSSVPFYRLPDFHAWLMAQTEYRASAHVSEGYFSRAPRGVLAELVASPAERPAPGENSAA